jgi:SAM-dependent methyltransferase
MKLTKIASELGRGVELTRRGGLRSGARFVREEVLGNLWLRAAALVPGKRAGWVECNLCGWRGPRFLSHCAVDYVDRNAFCPRCRSYARHRGFAWLWSKYLVRGMANLRGGSGLKLAFSPEPGLLRLLEITLGPIAGAGLNTSNPLVRYREDLQKLSFAAGSVDFVSCFHVLEHVRDDKRALRELGRVLSRRGRLALCVPITRGLPRTIDFGGPNRRLNDHCFEYGDDFPSRLTEAGFSGDSYSVDKLVPRELQAKLATGSDVFFMLRHTEAGREPRIEPCTNLAETRGWKAPGRQKT